MSAIPRFCVDCLPKFLDLLILLLIWWQSDKKQEILKQSCEDLLFGVDRTSNCLIIGSNVFNIEVNSTINHASNFEFDVYLRFLCGCLLDSMMS